MKTKGVIREYGEERAVAITKYKGRWVIRAFNEAGFNSTTVDIIDLVCWLRKNKPELLLEV